MTLDEILSAAAQLNASDIHLAVGNPPTARIDGELSPLEKRILTDEDTKNYAKAVLTDAQYEELLKTGQVDLAYRIPSKNVFRINVFRYSDQIGLACRIISDHIPTAKELDLPDAIEKVSEFPS